MQGKLLSCLLLFTSASWPCLPLPSHLLLLSASSFSLHPFIVPGSVEGLSCFRVLGFPFVAFSQISQLKTFSLHSWPCSKVSLSSLRKIVFFHQPHSPHAPWLYFFKSCYHHLTLRYIYYTTWHIHYSVCDYSSLSPLDQSLHKDRDFDSPIPPHIPVT